MFIFSSFWETAKQRTESSEVRAAWKIAQICSYFIQVYSEMWVCSYTEDLRTIKTVCPGWKPDGFQSELDILAPNRALALRHTFMLHVNKSFYFSFQPKPFCLSGYVTTLPSPTRPAKKGSNCFGFPKKITLITSAVFPGTESFSVIFFFHPASVDKLLYVLLSVSR